MFKNIGLVLAILTLIIGGYEALALVTPLPTLSRVMQGLRDGGHRFTVFMISQLFIWVLASFAAWLYYHLNYQARSGN